MSLGPVSVPEKTSFRKISWSLEAARFVFRIVRSFWNLTGTSAALLPMRLSNFKAIRQFKVPMSWLRDFTRSYEKTSFRILRRGPGGVRTVSGVWDMAYKYILLGLPQPNVIGCTVREIAKSSSTFSATNISCNIWFRQLHDTIKMKSNHTGINYNHNDIAIRSHTMMYNSV